MENGNNNTQAQSQAVKAAEELESLTPASRVESVLNTKLNTKFSAKAENDLEKKAQENVDKLFDFSMADVEKQEELKANVETLGLDLEKENGMSPMMKSTIRDVSKNQEGGNVGKALADLKIKVEELDPARVDFSDGWVSRYLGFLPFVGKPLKSYATQFETSQTVISAIMNSLEAGKEELQRDNVTLLEDQKRMKNLALRLEQAIKLVQMMDKKVVDRLKTMDAGDEKNFVEQQILFPLRQRIMDLQQTLMVNQQGVVALDVIIANNKELIKGAQRTKTVTVNALQVAVTVAMALENQKKTLDKIQAVESTTNDLIKGTAEKLKTQGTEINKKATNSTLNVENLKKAFSDIHDAMQEIETFKQSALPKMQQQIAQMDEMTSEAAKKIAEMEKGKQARSKLIDLES